MYSYTTNVTICESSVWHIPLLCVQWKTPHDGQRNCLRHKEFYCKNKFEKLLHLVGFIIRIYHDSRSPERQFITIHGHMNVNLSRCTVTWTSIYHDTRLHERQFITMHVHLNVKVDTYVLDKYFRVWWSVWRTDTRNYMDRGNRQTANSLVIIKYHDVMGWSLLKIITFVIISTK